MSVPRGLARKSRVRAMRHRYESDHARTDWVRQVSVRFRAGSLRLGRGHTTLLLRSRLPEEARMKRVTWFLALGSCSISWRCRRLAAAHRTATRTRTVAAAP